MDIKKLYKALHNCTEYDPLRPWFSGILHTNGYMIASDAFVVVKVHNEDYDFDYEDMIIGKNGEEIRGNKGEKIVSIYPTIELYVPDITTMKEVTDPFIINNLLQACKNMPKGSDEAGKRVTIILKDIVLHNHRLIKLYDVFEALGEKPTIYTGPQNRAIAMISENCQAFCFPFFASFAKGDITMTIQEALDYKK